MKMTIVNIVTEPRIAKAVAMSKRVNTREPRDKT